MSDTERSHRLYVAQRLGRRYAMREAPQTFLQVNDIADRALRIVRLEATPDTLASVGVQILKVARLD